MQSRLALFCTLRQRTWASRQKPVQVRREKLTNCDIINIKAMQFKLTATQSYLLFNKLLLMSYVVCYFITLINCYNSSRGNFKVTEVKQDPC